MKNLFFLLIGFFIAVTTTAQSNYAEAIQQGDAAFKKGQYKTAINKYFAAEAFDPSKKEVVKGKVNVVFDKIEELRKEAQKNEQKVQISLIETEKAKAKAQESEQKAQIAFVQAEEEKKAALLEKEKAEKQALTAYANDIVYKSKIALKDGDRNAAFRLAEFAYRFVEANNPNVLQALINALFYSNDNPANPYLPRVTNLEGHLNGVSSLAFSSDGKRLATGSFDNTVKIWDPNGGKALMTLEGHKDRIFCIAFSSDRSRLATGSFDNTVRIWDLSTAKIIMTFEDHTHWVDCVAFSPDNKHIATHSYDNTVRIWSLDTGQSTTKFETCAPSHTGVVMFSPDGERLLVGASGGNGGCFKIWDIKSNKEVKSFEKLQYGSFYSAAFSPDGKRFATADAYGTVRILDLEKREQLLSFEGNSKRIWSMAYSPDGKWLLIGAEDNTAKIWDAYTGKFRATLQGHKGNVLGVAFSPDGNRIATGASGDPLKVWDLDSTKVALIMTGYSYGANSSVAFSSDGKREANWTLFGSVLDIHDMKNGQNILTIKEDKYAILNATLSTDGKQLAIVAGDWTVKVWNVDTGKLIHSFARLTDRVGNVAFSPDGSLLAAGGSNIYDRNNKEVIIWNLASGEVFRILKDAPSSYSCIAFSPDNKALAVGVKMDDNALDSKEKIVIWNLNDWEPILTINPIDTLSEINCIAFSPDGKLLATGGNKMTKLWDSTSGRLFSTYESFDFVINVSYSPNGDNLITTLVDGTFEIWSINTGKALYTIPGVHSASYSYNRWVQKKMEWPKAIQVFDLDAEQLIHSWSKVGGLACLSLPQLKQFNLEHLLDQKPNNEEKLIATGEVWQIKAFADLAASQAKVGMNTIEQVEPFYVRSDRLYSAALALQDENLIRKDYAFMLRSWAAVCQSNDQTKKSAELRAKADKLWKE